jgi:F-box protein 21
MHYPGADIKAFIMHCKYIHLASRKHKLTIRTSSVEDTSIRYVAEENVEIIEPEEPISLMSLAGRYFKRWDRENCIFVSNIRDEYPEN